MMAVIFLFFGVYLIGKNLGGLESGPAASKRAASNRAASVRAASNRAASGGTTTSPPSSPDARISEEGGDVGPAEADRLPQDPPRRRIDEHEERVSRDAVVGRSCAVRKGRPVPPSRSARTDRVRSPARRRDPWSPRQRPRPGGPAPPSAPRQNTSHPSQLVERNTRRTGPVPGAELHHQRRYRPASRRRCSAADHAMGVNPTPDGTGAARPRTRGRPAGWRAWTRARRSHGRRSHGRRSRRS